MEKPSFNSNLKAGEIVYKVYALGQQSFIEKKLLSSDPYFDPKTTHYCSGWWIMCCTVYEDWTTDPDSHSLDDCNVILNNYNKHQLFFNLEEAERYLEQCKELHNNHGGNDLDPFWDDLVFLYDEDPIDYSILEE